MGRGPFFEPRELPGRAAERARLPTSFVTVWLLRGLGMLVGMQRFRRRMS